MNNTEFKEFLINIVGCLNTDKIKISDYKVVTNDKDLDMSKVNYKVEFTIKDYNNE